MKFSQIWLVLFEGQKGDFLQIIISSGNKLPKDEKKCEIIICAVRSFWTAELGGPWKNGLGVQGRLENLKCILSLKVCSLSAI